MINSGGLLKASLLSLAKLSIILSSTTAHGALC